MGAPMVPQSIKDTFRKEFKGALILSGGYDAARAESDLAAGRADLIAVGRPLLANPDLVDRWKAGAALNPPDANTFYIPGPKGYTDYPVLTKQPQPPDQARNDNQTIAPATTTRRRFFIAISVATGGRRPLRGDQTAAGGDDAKMMIGVAELGVDCCQRLK